MRVALLFCTGCMISGGPAVGYRQGHATIGGDIGVGAPFARLDYSRTYRIGGDATGKTINTFMLNFAIPFKTDPVGLCGIIGLGYGSGEGALQAGAFVSHTYNDKSDRQHETASVVAAAIGARYMVGASELWLTPQVGEMWFPGINF